MAAKFVCEHCNKELSSKESLKNHIKKSQKCINSRPAVCTNECAYCDQPLDQPIAEHLKTCEKYIILLAVKEAEKICDATWEKQMQEMIMKYSSLRKTIWGVYMPLNMDIENVFMLHESKYYSSVGAAEQFHEHVFTQSQQYKLEFKFCCHAVISKSTLCASCNKALTLNPDCLDCKIKLAVQKLEQQKNIEWSIKLKKLQDTMYNVFIEECATAMYTLAIAIKKTMAFHNEYPYIKPLLPTRDQIYSYNHKHKDKE